MKFVCLTMIVLLFSYAEKHDEKSQKALWESEIMTVEKSFNDMAQQDGLAKAFEHFAAEDGAIKRGKKVIIGKNAIRTYYEKDAIPGETLEWSPSFVDVSASGDMAYTYGNYTYKYIDSAGTKKESTGVFHTVWKR